MKPLFARISEETARVYGLTLASADIPHQIHRLGRLWAISVYPHHRSSAITSIALYRRENPIQQSFATQKSSDLRKTYSALYVIFFLALIHWAVGPGYEHKVFVDTFGADARQIMTGEFYRCITALLFHQDWSHVLNNMIGLALFGTVVASISGWGIGWFMIGCSGAVGNMVTAIWYRQDHIAIGASTAVFGALGICVSLNVWHHYRFRQTEWRMWLPLAAGLALLGFLGSSPQSDLMAHFSGFCSGIVIGGVYGGVHRWLSGIIVQWAAAAMGVGVTALAWICGMYAAGG